MMTIRLEGFLALGFGMALLSPAAFAIQVDAVQVVEPAPPANPVRFGKLELLVTLSGVVATKPFDPDPAQGGLNLTATFTAPSSAAYTVPGFWDGSAWRVRFAPLETGAWTYTVSATDSSGSATSSSAGFTCDSSSHAGFARIDGRYLRFSGNNQVFFGIGHNNGWQYNLRQPDFPALVAKKINLMSFWMNAPWIAPTDGTNGHRAPIENVTDGLGNYSQGPCAYLDQLVRDAEASGVYLLPSLWSHGQLRRDGTHNWGDGFWENNPYQTVCTAADFFKRADGLGNDTPQWRYQKNFFRYILARWGYSRAIAGWVLVVEIDGTTAWDTERDIAQDGARPVAEGWCAEARKVFAGAAPYSAFDPYRVNSSGQYPIVTSRTDFYPSFETWSSGENQRAADSYTQQNSNLGIALAVANQTRNLSAAGGKPAFHSEFGGRLPGGATQPEHAHYGLWAGVAAGAALTPSLWCDGGEFPLLTDAADGAAMQDQFLHMADFFGTIPYQGDSALVAATLPNPDAFTRGWGMRLSDRGFAWVQSTSGPLGGETLNLSTLDSGFYDVKWYDVWSNGAVPGVTQSGVRVETTGPTAGQLVVSIPGTTRTDWALSFTRTGDLPPDPVVTIAQDNFESGGLAGGTGWAGAWIKSGDAGIVKTGVPHLGRWHARLRSGTGLLTRTVNLTGVTQARLKFWTKVQSFESNDTAAVKINTGSGGDIAVLTLTSAQSDGVYRYYNLDLSAYAMTANFKIVLDSNMNGTSDFFYVDDLEVTGVTP